MKQTSEVSTNGDTSEVFLLVLNYYLVDEQPINSVNFIQPTRLRIHD